MGHGMDVMGFYRRILAAVGVCLWLLTGLMSPSGAAASSKPRARIISFSDSLRVPTGPEMQSDLKLYSGCAKPVKGSVTFAKALGETRALVGKAGAGAMKKVEKGPDANPQRAELDAADAMANNNPAGALAALLSAYDHDPKNPTHLRNIGAILGHIYMPKEALAFFARADAIKAKPQAPMGISEVDSESTNRGYALMELGQYNQAAKVLQPVVNRDSRISEAKTDLGMALQCLGQPGRGAALVAAGARRNTFPKTETEGIAPDAVTQASPNLYLDLSRGHAGALPYLDFPKSVSEVERDGNTYWKPEGMGTTVQYFSDQMMADSNQASALMQKSGLYTMPPATLNRILDLQAAASDAEMGGFQPQVNAADKADEVESMLFTDVFSGECGLACQKATSIENANPGADYCSVIWPQMSDWLTKETKIWAADMQALDVAQGKEWSARSKWATAVYANISNPKIVKAFSLQLDSVKQSEMYGLTSDIGFWESGVEGWNLGGQCSGKLGSGTKPPAEKKVMADACPQALKDHGFSFSAGIISVSTDCDSFSITVSDELLGPFARISLSQSGNVTITMGAQAGVSMGPMSAGVEAGVYVTIGSSGVTDLGVTANASTSAGAGSVHMTVGQAGYTGSFIDSSSTPGFFVQ